MEPISSNSRTPLDEPTPAEIEAGASLPREPEPLESRLTEAPPESAAAVKSLVEKYPPAVSAVPAVPSQGSAAGPSGAAHPGLAVGISANIAAGPGVAVGAEASIGVVVDLKEARISVFTSAAWGTAIAPGGSAGVSGQASGVKDVRKFWGSGAEHGVNLSAGGISINHTTPEPGGPRELNGATVSLGPSLGGDAHYFEGSTTERWGTSLNQIKEALQRALDPNDSICVGP